MSSGPKIAALYDIHGQPAALAAVLAQAAALGAAALVVGGDVLPGPRPRETLALLRACRLPLHCLLGNGDRETLATRAGRPNPALPPAARLELERCAGLLDAADAAWIASWPPSLTLPTPAGEVFFCHATARNDTDIFTVRTPDAKLVRAFSAVAAPTIVCGHTHMPFDRRLGRQRILNAGSVGMPFGDPSPAWLLIGETLELRRTAFPLDPNPPAAAAMLDLFARSEMP